MSKKDFEESRDLLPKNKVIFRMIRMDLVKVGALEMEWVLRKDPINGY